MADGTTREGRVVEANDKEVVVDFGRGSVSLLVRLPRAEVARIERKATPDTALMDDYVARLGKALNGGAEAWYDLGLWCWEQRCLNDKAREAFERAIAIDSDHAGARAALGHVKLNDAWMPRKEAIRLLAPELTETAKMRELAAQKQAEEAKAQALEARKGLEKLKARLAELERENRTLRERVAAPPPPPPDYYRPRVVYRPIIIYRDRPRRRSSEGDAKEKTPQD
jgi:tetratricopeptide (TPR) repeat protein